MPLPLYSILILHVGNRCTDLCFWVGKVRCVNAENSFHGRKSIQGRSYQCRLGHFSGVSWGSSCPQLQPAFTNIRMDSAFKKKYAIVLPQDRLFHIHPVVLLHVTP